MNTHTSDLVVIGSGPGGYVAAIRAAQLGLNVICIEKENFGGVCLNIGCIPTKALLRSAEHMHFLNNATEFGFDIPEVKVDFPKVIQRSRDVSTKMSQGVAFLLKKYKVQTIKGTGFIKSKNVVEVTDADGNPTDTINTKNIIIATGARPRMFPGIDVDKVRVLTSTQAMLQTEIPSSMIIMGAGAIGVEFAYFYNAFGTKVTIIEMMDRLLPIEDVDVSNELGRHYKKYGITVLTKTKVLSAKTIGNEVEVTIEKKDGSQEVLKADLALNAIGIQANTENIGLEGVGVLTEKGFIKVDNYLKTNVEGIYAIGDVAGAPWLAHKASAEAIICAEIIAGHHPQPMDYSNIPGCTYCQPQVASVGLTEAKAKELGHDIKVGKFPFSASGKANGIGETKGFVKIVFDAKHGEVLGAHMIGPEVTELIAEIGLARSLDATAQTIIKTIHAHPTLSEAIMEASAQAYGEAVNL